MLSKNLAENFMRAGGLLGVKLFKIVWHVSWIRDAGLIAILGSLYLLLDIYLKEE